MKKNIVEKKQITGLVSYEKFKIKLTKKMYLALIMLITVHLSYGQHIALTFQETEKHGISIQHLDSIYKNAVNSDTALAIFKTDTEQEKLQQSYTRLLKDLASFLSKNNFKWEKKTPCFNKVYFNKDGAIDYFLYFFRGNAEDNPSELKQKEFQRLLSLFIKDYKFALTANTKFTQCGGAVYMPEL
jgi:hypothetical protein